MIGKEVNFDLLKALTDKGYRFYMYRDFPLERWYLRYPDGSYSVVCDSFQSMYDIVNNAKEYLLTKVN
jgi:hypothetical protein